MACSKSGLTDQNDALQFLFTSVIVKFLFVGGICLQPRQTWQSFFTATCGCDERSFFSKELQDDLVSITSSHDLCLDIDNKTLVGSSL